MIEKIKDFSLLRKDFQILDEKINGHNLVYFDNAATSQRPNEVLHELMEFYTKYNSNIHRSANAFGQKATVMFEGARQKIAKFINAKEDEIIFTSGTTESINFVAFTWALDNLKAGDEIVLSEIEHHSNLVPWQQVAKRVGAHIKFIPINKDFRLDLENLEQIINKKTKIVAISQASNLIGSHFDLSYVIKIAKEVGAKVLIDAAQSSPHRKIDVKSLNCDFMAFSGHKMLAPTGIGILYIKKELQENLSPYQFGGGMVFEVDYDKASWCKTNRRFEAGTQPIAQVIGFGAAIDYFEKNIDFELLKKHEANLCSKMVDGLLEIGGIEIIGSIEDLKKEGHLVSFCVNGIHPHDVAAYLSEYGICTRAGHNCVQPFAKKIGIDASVRASFYFYNTELEVDYFLNKMAEIRDAF